jgi:tetrahydromethanopterin S-methyltransferase subunit E
LTLFDLSVFLEKKRHSNKKKRVGIIVGSTLIVVGMIIVGLVSYIWKKKLKNPGKKFALIIIYS